MWRTHRFETTLYRLRQLVGNAQAIQHQEGRLSLDPRYWWVDAWAFERMVDKVDFHEDGFPSSRRQAQGRRNPSFTALVEKAMGLYKGDFLQTDAAYTWTLTYREGLQSKFHRLVTCLGRYWEEAGDYGKALEVFRKGIEVDNLAEEFYQRLMVNYQRLGQEASAVKVYRRCRSVLLSELGALPSSRTEEIYASLRRR